MEEQIVLCVATTAQNDQDIMYNVYTEAELRNVAELWYRVDQRETVMVSNEEIVWVGQSLHKSCTYGLVAYTENVIKIKKDGVKIILRY